MQTVQLCNNELPVCPFVWIYDKIIFPINSMIILPQNEQIFDKVNNNKLINELDKYKHYKYYIYEIEQEFINIDDKSNYVNISFHSWFYTTMNVSNVSNKNKRNTKRNMKHNMKHNKIHTTLLSGLFTYCDDNCIEQINEKTLSVNSINKMNLSIHNNKLSPKLDNLFKININNSNNNSDNKIKFVSVCINEQLQQICITLHTIVI